MSPPGTCFHSRVYSRVLAAAARLGSAVHKTVAPVIFGGAAGFGGVNQKVGSVNERIAFVVRCILDLADCARFTGFVANLLHRVRDENFSLLLRKAPGRERDLRASLPRCGSRGQLRGVLVLEAASTVAVRRRGSSASSLVGNVQTLHPGFPDTPGSTRRRMTCETYRGSNLAVKLCVLLGVARGHRSNLRGRDMSGPAPHTEGGVTGTSRPDPPRVRHEAITIGSTYKEQPGQSRAPSTKLMRSPSDACHDDVVRCQRRLLHALHRGHAVASNVDGRA